jgi:imidazolonepropionase-like amidohydrolase
MKRTLIAVLSLLFVLSLAAQEKVVVIRAARMIDGKSDAVIAPAVVIVRGKTIEKVGRDLAIPAGAEVIDLGDMTLLPGLIDAHVHVMLQGDVTEEDYDVQLFKESLPYRALRASRAAKIALDRGFTTMRDIGNEGAMYTDVDVKRAINNGVIPGPRLQVATRALAVTGAYGPSGYSPEITFPKGVELCDGVDECRKAVREQVSHGADWIKVYADRSYFLQKDGTLSSVQNFNAEEMKAIVDEAHRLRRKAAAHAMARPGIENALNAGIDSIEHGIAIPDDLLDRMKAQGTYLSPTLTVTEYVAPGRAAEGRPIWAKIPEFHRDSFNRAVRKGVKIAFGTDAGGFPWEVNQCREFTYMTKNGMTPMQALRAATIVPAEMMDLADKVGSLEAGKLADIIAVPGNPLSDITVMERVGFVMKDGGVVRR